MNILFLTFGDVTLHSWSARPVSVVRALADAGHRVDVVAAQSDLPAHPNVRMLGFASVPRMSCVRLRMRMLSAVCRSRYDAVHAVGPAAFCVAGLCRLKKIPLVYDAECRYRGFHGKPPSVLWNVFPSHFRRVEKRLLERAGMVLCNCETLADDLAGMAPEAVVAQLEDVPLQPFFGAQPLDFSRLLGLFRQPPTALVVCSVLPGNRPDLRKPLVAARKVIDAVPRACFVFKGASVKAAEALAANLDIRSNCVFIEPGDTETFLSALSHADVALLLPHPQGRYVHPEVFTMLNSPAPLVAVQDHAYRNLLNEGNCIPALPSAESIAECVIRAIQEPLFSLGVASQGQLLIAERHAYSSFKHKLRMAYLGMVKQG